MIVVLIEFSSARVTIYIYTIYVYTYTHPSERPALKYIHVHTELTFKITRRTSASFTKKFLYRKAG